MSNRLNRINDWSDQARQAKWRVEVLAKNCRVSLRTLERYFHEHMSATPHHWLSEDRQRRAREFLLDGLTVKETAVHLGYNNPHHFSREFKKHVGHSPSQHAADGTNIV